MKGNQRPLSITILACLYIAVGIVGFAYHFSELRANSAFVYDTVWVELVEVVAIIAGACMLRRNNWARWLAFLWIAFHVILSAFHSFQEFAVHCVFFAVFAWVIFRPATARYFRNGRVQPT